MFLSKAPLRISLAGGGSDIPEFYKLHDGHVLSFAINKYVYIVFHETYHSGIRLSYSMTEHVQDYSDVKHPLFRNCMKLFEPPSHIEIGSFADVPSSGTGLGSSSAFTVALLHGLSTLKGNILSKEDLATLACKVEIEMCGDPIGKQDQFASAFGGFNELVFHSNDSTTVHSIPEDSHNLHNLIENLHLYDLNISRSASEILSQQVNSLQKKTNAVALTKRMKEQVRPMLNAVKDGDLETIGLLLNENWEMKRSLTSITSNTKIDEIYSRAITMGAFGGKVLGAGGGGFLLLSIRPDISHKFEANFGLRRIRYKLDSQGSNIIYL